MRKVTVVSLLVTAVLPSMAPAKMLHQRVDEQASELRSESLRRDPFVSVLEPVSQPLPKRVITSLEDVTLNEITLKGIVRFGGAHVAVVLAPDRKTYLLRLQERLRDATLRALTSDAAIFAQRVLEPPSVVREREVIKFLRPREGSR